MTSIAGQIAESARLMEIVRIVLGFFLGLFYGSAVGFFGSAILISMLRMPIAERSTAMNIALVILPGGALVGGTAGAFWAAL